MPGTSGCRSANDRAAQTLVVDAPEASASSEGVVFAVAAEVGGDSGTFAATPMSITGSWQVATGSGEFTYSYPISVPEPGGGSAPSVSLGYSSGAIDGLTVATNTQPSPSGLGWSDFANAFIERRYEPCIQVVGTADLCWKSDNATISLAGISGPLVPVNAAHTEWRVQTDPGWKIERTTDAPYTTIYQHQRWRVTGPDGTVYHFGYGHMPGRQTNSILAVPVLGDNPGDPCWDTVANGVGGCDQGWRWYLDLVVDPDGNVHSLLYERENNWYSAIGGLSPHQIYHRGALLKEIIYGGRGWDSNTYAARVTFGLEWRCVYLVAACPAPAPASTGFPDVPTDLVCTATSNCTVHAPSFFVGRRYSFVRTDVKVGNAWKAIAQYNLLHTFGSGANGVAQKLQLSGVQQAAIAFGKLNAYPNTVFTYAFRDNRADHGGIISKAMRHNRLTQITNPYGGRTIVTYGQNRSCASTYNPWPRWDLNVRDCFPQSIRDGNLTRTGVFNKYLVTKVVVSPGGGSPDMTTTYAYGGDPAWAFDTGAFARDQDETGWSIWRGYGTTTMTRGSEKTQARVFRGWDGDWMLVQDGGGDWIPVQGRRSVPVQTFGANPLSYPDHRALAGRMLEEQQLGTLDGVADSVLQSRRYEYERRVTVDPGPDYLFDAEWVGQTLTTESVASAPNVFRQRRSQTTYNANLQPTSTLEEGWLDQTGDERCTITTYADNPAKGMVVYPAMNKKVAGDCASTQTLSLTETYYDGGTTLGGPPVAGNATRLRTMIDNTRWSQTLTEYDALGRPTKVTGPTGAVTTTVYAVTASAPVTQIPIQTTVTNALGQQAVTDFVPEFGVPARERDANGNLTEYSYDEFGRLIAMWLPTEPIAVLEPSWRFAYDIPNRAVRARHLTSESRCCTGVVFEDTWQIYDGLWRERQTQAPSPVTGKVLAAETTYDDRGLVQDEMVEQALTGTAGKHISGGTTWKNRTRHSYDELGRETRREWFRDNTVAHATTTVYGTDTVTVTGPDGRKVRERVDGLGRTVAVEEFDGTGWVSSSYRYDLADRLVSVTDPAGNRTDYAYNLAGWKIAQSDPGRGGAFFGYDDAGNQTGMANSGGHVVITSYDLLGRQLERRTGSATGPLLASWQYDTAPGGKGLLHKETTHTPSGGWVSEVVGYDPKSRPTGNRLTVPAGIPGLSGQYTVTRTYDRADRVVSVAYPAIGNLPVETVTTEYNPLGLPTRMAGLDEYVWGVAYDDRGRRSSARFGPRLFTEPWLAKTWLYNVDQRIAGVQTYVAGSAAPNGIVAQHDLTFDLAGNLTEDLTNQNGAAWRECFGYDARSRLTAAYTVAAATACTGGQPGTGDRPYSHTYQYSPDGRLLARTENGTSTAYTYPAAGAARPHAPTRVGPDTYTWDLTGNLASRTVAGTTETFAWDAVGRLQSVSGPSGSSSYVYDPSGQRLLRRTPDGRATLYAFGHEVTVTAAGAVVTAVRPYTFDGGVIATRTAAGVDYLVSDADGSVEMAVPAGGLPAATRTYAPFGRTLTEAGDFATDRGFVGQFEDASTRLSYLNARYYDSRIGLFISPDSIMDTGKVKTLNPYTYSAGNPTTFADPSGQYSVYTWGLEMENARLRAINKQLLAHIGKLNNHIEYLQDIIRKQQKQINKLISYVGALEAEIARQASIIRQLQDRVRYLEGVVAAQAREISRLRRVVAYQQRVIRYQAGIIRYQAGVIRYQQGVIGALVNIAILPEYRQTVFNSIVSGHGIPLVRSPGQTVDLGGSEPLVVPPGPWRVMGNAVEQLERVNAIQAGQLMAQDDYIADLQFESDYPRGPARRALRRAAPGPECHGHGLRHEQRRRRCLLDRHRGYKVEPLRGGRERRVQHLLRREVTARRWRPSGWAGATAAVAARPSFGTYQGRRWLR